MNETNKRLWRMFLWYIGLSEKCPYCNIEVVKHGFDGHNERYTCSNCGFKGYQW